MAYYLESLVKVIERILCPDQRKFFNDKTIQQIESLLEKACFLRDSLANSATFGENRFASVEDQIRYAAQDAEDVLETYAGNHLSRKHSGLYFLAKRRIPLPDLQKLLENFDSAKEVMLKMDLDGAVASSRPSPAVSSWVDQNPKKIVVGFTNDLVQLMDRVFGDSTKLEIIPIVGMGGIGKTTLARKIYDDESVISHFDSRAWTTVSDDYSLRDILLGLVSCITGRHRDEMNQDNQLSVTLHQNLMGRRYLVILDDIWRSKAWDDVKMFFPNENNGSRIILTTRESNVATYADSKTLHHQVHPLSHGDSWKLLREKVFGEETCLPELEQLGIKIAKDCRGLPLSIQVVGGLLSHTKRTKDSWKQVAVNVSSAIANKEEQVLKILSLSYDNLPYYLKPCFLYMSAFPEDYHISVPKLIRLWVAEGFLKSIEGKSIEEAAEEHLKALIDRNLIFVSWQKIGRKVKFCIMHDLLRDLCVMKAREEKFFHVMNGQTDNIPEDMLCLRRASVHWSRRNMAIYHSIRQMSLARSLIFMPRDFWEINSPVPFSALRLLRVLDVLDIEFNQFPQDILQLVNLRYLAFFCKGPLHSGITTFRNLQILIARVPWRTKVSHEIFGMPQLREIVFIGESISCKFKKSKNELVLQENLQSVSKLEVSKNYDVVLAKFPNLKTLAIHYSYKSDSKVADLTFLRKLETLKFSSGLTSNAKKFLSNLSFPISVKMLILYECEVSEAVMKTIGMLPNLEILKLKKVSFETKKWEPSEGEFCKLQYLLLFDVKLVHWQADENHFPRLQHLKIGFCYSFLGKVPSGIGEISTLKTIDVTCSSFEVWTSVRKIQEEQLELGNDLLQVQITK